MGCYRWALLGRALPECTLALSEPRSNAAACLCQAIITASALRNHIERSHCNMLRLYKLKLANINLVPLIFSLS